MVDYEELRLFSMNLITVALESFINLHFCVSSIARKLLLRSEC